MHFIQLVAGYYLQSIVSPHIWATPLTHLFPGTIRPCLNLCCLSSPVITAPQGLVQALFKACYLWKLALVGSSYYYPILIFLVIFSSPFNDLQHYFQYISIGLSSIIGAHCQIPFLCVWEGKPVILKTNNFWFCNLCHLKQIIDHSEPKFLIWNLTSLRNSKGK